MTKNGYYGVWGLVLLVFAAAGCGGPHDGSDAARLAPSGVVAGRAVSTNPMSKIDPSWFESVSLSISDEEYRFGRLGDGYSAFNRANGLRAAFDAQGWRLRSGAFRPGQASESETWTFSLTFAGLARPTSQAAPFPQVTPLPAGVPLLGACDDSPRRGVKNECFRQVEWTRGAVTEFVRNRPEGLEQGFVIRERSAGTSGPLTIALDYDGLTARMEEEGKIVFRDERADRLVYSQLVAKDAGGKRLASALRLSQGRIWLTVEDADAQYPLLIDPLLTSAWEVSGAASFERLGLSVASAGDINGDGFGDVIIGAMGYTDLAYSSRGAAFIYTGTAQGLDKSGTAQYKLYGPDNNSLFGNSVAGVGDVNNDGYDDILIGVVGYRNTEDKQVGKALLYLGSANGIPNKSAWSVTGDQAHSNFANVVAAAGDVNGDGYADFLIGASQYDNGQTNEGAVSLYLGTSDPEKMSKTPSWQKKYTKANAFFGASLSSAGDVNGDGFADVLIGVPGLREVLLYKGSSTGLSASPVWSVTAPETAQDEALLGFSLAAAGDVNGDGYADFLIGAAAHKGSMVREGIASLYLGSASWPGNVASWSLTGGQSEAEFGYSVAGVGDVNGDGIADFVVGARNYANDSGTKGRVFLYLGSAGGVKTGAFWGEGGTADEYFGTSVAAAGDVNGDGLGDFIVGSPSYSTPMTDPSLYAALVGKAYVFLGATSLPKVQADWTYEDDQPYEQFGYALANAGDVNGDGFGDLLVGAPYYSSEQAAGCGRAFLFLGTPDGLSADAAWTKSGETEGARFGAAVAGAGDVNGDGYDDMLIGIPGYGTKKAGRVELYNGSTGVIADTAVWSAEGEFDNAELGFAVSGAGDVNRDGYADVIVGEPGNRDNLTHSGRALVFSGSAAGLSAAPVWMAEDGQARSQFGYSVAGVGDVNGDGFADVAVGAPLRNDSESFQGKALIYLGSANGLAATAERTLLAASEATLFGYSVAAAGDVNADGYADILVGEPGGHVLSGSFPGYAHLYLGSSDGVSATAVWTAAGSAAGAAFGQAVATAGDVNGDGYADILVGAPLSQTGLGQVELFTGKAGGPANTPAWTVSGEIAYGLFGSALAGGNDVNGDGYADVVVGAPNWSASPTSSASGRVSAFYGNDGGGLSLVPRQWWTNEDRPVAAGGFSDSQTSVRLSLQKRSHIGRTKLKLQWEMKKAGVPFDGKGIETGDSWVEIEGGPIDPSFVAALATPDSPGGVYHWRARLRYPNGTWSRWISFRPTGNGYVSNVLLTSCGDGIIAGLENCEQQDPATHGCCDVSSCRRLAPQSPCGVDEDHCEIPDTCDADGHCIDNGALDDGTACDTLNLCNRQKECHQGKCEHIVEPVTCSALDECHTVGVCDPATGLCSDPPVADDTVCGDDGNACNGRNSCRSGLCVTTTPEVVCALADACHEAGVCDPQSGVCAYAKRADGTSCDDGNLCNGADICTDGVCTATEAPKTCTALDECHGVGECDPLSGLCSNPPLADGGVCGLFGDHCNSENRCQSGACTPFLSANESCSKARPLSLNLPLQQSLGGCSAEKPNAGLGFTGADAFYSYGYAANEAFLIRVTPEAALDLALLGRSSCADETPLFTQNAGDVGVVESYTYRGTDSGTLILQVLARDASMSALGFRVEILPAPADPDGDADADADAEGTESDLEGEEAESESEMANEQDADERDSSELDFAELPDQDSADTERADSEADAAELEDREPEGLDADEVPHPSHAGGGCQSSAGPAAQPLLALLVLVLLMRRRRGDSI